MANIGLDFDGVIVDSVRLKIKYAQELYGISLSPADCKKDVVLSKRLMTKEEYDTLNSLVYGTRVGLHLDAIYDSVDYIKILKEKHNVRIITSRLNRELNTPEIWLEEHGISVPVIYTNQRPKNEFCSGLDLFVDDDYPKLEELVNSAEHLVLFSRPYNQDVEIKNSRIQRIDSWAFLYKFIKETLE